MSFKLKKNKGNWIKFPENEDIQFLIKPFSLFTLKYKPAFEMTPENFTMEDIGNVFVACVLDWKGITGEDDKPVECNEENKREMVECEEASEIVSFVYSKVINMQVGEESKEKEIKN